MMMMETKKTTTTTTSKRGVDIEEYVDYSCSTPLERASRDVETILRSWHICDGSDRHVSFRHATSTTTTTNNNNNNNNNNHHSLTPRKKRLSSRFINTNNAKNNNGTPFRPSPSRTNNNNDDNGVQLIRSATIVMTNVMFSNSTNNKNKKCSLELSLCLWDGPATTTTTTTTTTTNHGGGLLPWSLVSNRGMGQMPPDVTSSLSALLGIGQHLTLTPTTNNNAGNDNEQQQQQLNAIMELLIGPSLQHASRDAPYYDALANVTLHATALQTLASQLQTILNLACSQAQCLVPAFGIWGTYTPHQQQQQHNSTTQHQHDSNKIPLMHTIMNVPSWLNPGGQLFQLAADTSPCRVFASHNNNESTNQQPSKSSSVYPFKVEHKGWKGSKSERAQKCIADKQLNPNAMNIPPLVTGYCVSSSHALCSAGASFAIHVVPPGIAFPIHCTTLNSLGQLLLQHSPPLPHNTTHNTTNHSPTSSNHHNPSDYGKVVVSCARHKYHWSQLFETNHNNNNSTDIVIPSFHLNDDRTKVLFLYTYGHAWRQCLLHHKKKSNNNDTAISKYERDCRHHMYRLLQFAANNANHLQTYNDIVNDVLDDTDDDEDYYDFLSAFYDPMWGPTEDPLDTIAVSVTWDHHSSSSDTTTSTANDAPLLSLPLRIRSHNTLSSHDVLEMENTLLSNIFNPLYVSSGKKHGFQLSVWYDGNAACTTLSATNRCLLASTIRATTLDPDTLLGHVTNPRVVQQLHDRESLDDIVCDLMDLSHVGPVTRRLVEVLDWAGMADILTTILTESPDNDIHAHNSNEGDNDSSQYNAMTGGWRQRLVKDVLDGKFHGPSFGGSFGFPPTSSAAASAADGVHFGFGKATPPGRLVSLLCMAMSSLRTPAAIATVWLTFVQELRIRWERRETLGNLLDTTNNNNSSGNNNNNNTNSSRSRSSSSGGLGHLGELAAILHASEPDPDRTTCWLHQKLQVYNIGVESILASEAETFRQHQQQQAELAQQQQAEEKVAQQEFAATKPEAIVQDAWGGQSEAPTEIMTNHKKQHNHHKQHKHTTSSSNNNNSGGGGLSLELLQTFNEQQQQQQQQQQPFVSMGHIAEDEVYYDEEEEEEQSSVGVNSSSLHGSSINNNDDDEQDLSLLQSLEGFDIDNDDNDNDNEINDNNDNYEVEPKQIALDSLPAPILLNHDPSPLLAQFDNNDYNDDDNNNDGRPPSPAYTNSSKDDFLTAIETATFESCTVGRISPTHSELNDSTDDDDDDANNNNNVTEKKKQQVVVVVEEKTAFVMQRQARRGARCPVLGLNLTASGDQLYAPYLLRTLPITDDVQLQRRLMVSSSSSSSHQNNDVAARIAIAHRLQKPKLMSDMCAFKAANPGAVFQDFINWYGNPENPLQDYQEPTNTNTNTKTASSSSCMEDASEAIQIMMSIRSFWSDCWDDAEPCPASEQNPLYDAMGSVEMMLQDLESMHPAHLMNQVLAVNLAMANFILQEAADPILLNNIPLVRNTLSRLQHQTQIALDRLAHDMTEGTLPAKQQQQQQQQQQRNNNNNDTNNNNDATTNWYVSPDTIAVCESVCDHIGDTEIIMARASSLLSKMPGEYDLIHQLLTRPEGDVFVVSSTEGRSGILNTIQQQQQQTNNHGNGNDDRMVSSNNQPYPSVREYILQNRDNPCQLTVRIGGTHGLENGGNNSTMGGLVLAINQCLRN